ncbi:tetratricopeptide repeat-containing diguanylate cyclase [Pseudoalteromonas sp. MMG012]|uniref:diguanylate cyclase domain-containing protein n=1 Tax=Pseudoalteromonas sp. MMG012 TaxID=2822686 RepID=UPI001B3A0452|nr:tetratricopeptide repeat-containing diguanylate cyclase [Pseudoalteromonas sp. MMG012]MBQ4848882.1 GGDEF domain-containing protein [Pseudoalteromonas sp. MMG012]
MVKVFLAMVAMFVWLSCFQPVQASGNDFLELEQQVLKSPELHIELANRWINTSNSADTEFFLSALSARAFFFAGHIERSKKEFSRFSSTLKTQQFSWGAGYWYLYRSFFAIEQGHLDDAKRLVKQSKRAFTHVKDSAMLVRVQAMEAVISIWREEYSEALKSVQAAHAYIMRNDIGDVSKLAVLDSLTAYYSTLKYHRKAIEFANQANVLAVQTQNVLDGLPIKYNLCMALLRSKLVEKARSCYSDMLVSAKRLTLPRYHFWANAGLGKVSLLLKEYDEAVDYFLQAKELEYKAIVNPAHLIVLHNNLAKALSSMSRYAQAQIHLKESLSILDNYQSPLNNRYMRRTLKLKAHVLDLQQDYIGSIAVLNRYIRLLEENELATKEVLEQEAQSFFEAEQHKFKLALTNEKLKAQAANLAELEKEEQLSRAYIFIAFLSCISIGLFAYLQRKASLVNRNFAYRDPLTELFNRRYFQEHIDKLSHQKQSFSLAMLDLDYFKRINDVSGHDIGDEILVRFGQHLRSHFRDDADVVCRYGGEEFVVVCQFMDVSQLTQRLEMLQAVLRENLSHDSEAVTFSAGVVNSSDYSKDTLIKAVDELMYRSKKLGRDKISS